MEKAPSIDQCLSDESYESLDMIALAIDETEQGNWTMDMMGITAFVHLYLDNEKNCNFDKIMLDSISFCFINNCAYDKLIGNVSQNWAQAIYAFNMLWTTIFSMSISDFSLINDYRFYHQVGESGAILTTSMIGFRPADQYDYDPDDSSYLDDQ